MKIDNQNQSNKVIQLDTHQDQKALDEDKRLRILANLIIDRILEDQQKGKLRFEIS